MKAIHYPVIIQYGNSKKNYDFIELLSYIFNTEKSYSIPKIWPTLMPQYGLCCGIYALAIALNYQGYTHVTARKKDQKSEATIFLREKAKQINVTKVGEILRVNDFLKIIEQAGFKQFDYTAIQADGNNFNKLVCEHLDSGKSVIVSCDCQNNFPADTGGRGIHWVLIFGYFYSQKDELFYLVAQDNNYCIWQAEKLHLSNDKLNGMSSKSFRFWYLLKSKETPKPEREWEWVPKFSTPEDSEKMPEFDFKQFKFSIFSVPVSIENQKKLMILSENKRSEFSNN